MPNKKKLTLRFQTDISTDWTPSLASSQSPTSTRGRAPIVPEAARQASPSFRPGGRLFHLAHAELHAPARGIHREHAHPHDLPDGDDRKWIADEAARKL